MHCPPRRCRSAREPVEAANSPTTADPATTSLSDTVTNALSIFLSGVSDWRFCSHLVSERRRDILGDSASDDPATTLQDNE